LSAAISTPNQIFFDVETQKASYRNGFTSQRDRHRCAGNAASTYAKPDRFTPSMARSFLRSARQPSTIFLSPN